MAAVEFGRSVMFISDVAGSVQVLRKITKTRHDFRTSRRNSYWQIRNNHKIKEQKPEPNGLLRLRSV